MEKNLISIVTGNEFRCFTPTNLKIEFKSFRKKGQRKKMWYPLHAIDQLGDPLKYQQKIPYLGCHQPIVTVLFLSLLRKSFCRKGHRLPICKIRVRSQPVSHTVAAVNDVHYISERILAQKLLTCPVEKLEPNDRALCLDVNLH
jgi:hypothetical protein